MLIGRGRRSGQAAASVTRTFSPGGFGFRGPARNCTSGASEEAMKFSDKYELLESVTKGQVRSFLAREVATRNRVLVHIFDCPGDHSGQMAGQWVLHAFRNLAPNPPGQVLEVGSYQESSFAYLVTKMPEPAVLQAWVRAYKMHSGSTEDFSKEVKGADITTGSLDVQAVQQILGTAEPTTCQAPAEAAPAVGEFTKAFWDLAGKPETRSEAGLPGAIPPTSASQSEEQTRLRVNPGPGTQNDPRAPVQQAQNRTSDNFTDAFMKLGQASLSQQERMAGEAKPLVEFPSKMEPLGPIREKPQVKPNLPVRPEPGAFTKEFLSVLDADLKPAKPAAVPAIEEAKRQSPGAFTREFLMVPGVGQEGSGTTSSGATTPPPDSPMPARLEEPVDENRRGGSNFTNLFQGSSAEVKGTNRECAAAPGNKAATGEFSSFFGGPFQAPAASEVPVSFPDVLNSAPEKKDPGDFTRMFGSLKGGPGAPQRLNSDMSGQAIPDRQDRAAPALESSEATPFTGPGVLSFARKSGTPSPAQVGYSEPWGRGFMPAAPARPENDAVLPAHERTMERRSAPAGATQVFVPRGGDAESATPPMSSGPSEFTRIISNRAPGPNPQAESPVSPNVGAGRFSMPAIPQMPAPPQIPGMQTPQMPAMGMPQMPAMSMPQMPQSPPKAQVPASGGKMPYLPLIIIFNVLFIAAVIIVLYFAFKH